MGWYVDLGYDVARLWQSKETKLYPFIRYSQHNGGELLGEKGTVSQPTLGVAFFPIEKVSFKIDYSIAEAKGVDGATGLLNLGAGYVF